MGETPSNTEGRSTRRSFLTAAGGAGMVALAGCTGDDSDDTDAGDSDTGDGDTGDGDTGDDDTGGEEQVLQLSIPPTDSFDNIRIKGDGSTQITNQVYAGLLTHPEGGLEPVGEIATNVEISDDFQTYTFELDENAVFHNGDPVRAQDFIYSWERAVGSPNAQETRHITTDVPVEHEVEAESYEEATYPDDYVPGSLAVEAVDDKTLRMNLRFAWHSTLEKLTIGPLEPVPEGLVDDAPGYDGEL
ncbi:peptide ABC transporter substrate-binding protein, partial [Halobacteriales archaeon QH_10_67_13]